MILEKCQILALILLLLSGWINLKVMAFGANYTVLSPVVLGILVALPGLMENVAGACSNELF